MPITAIRISDPHILERIESEQSKRREGTPTQTARRLITERLIQIEEREERHGAAEVVPSVT